MNVVIVIILIMNGVYMTDYEGKTIYAGSINLPYKCFQTPPQQMPGWPKQMGVNPNYSPSGVCLADINGDGDLEIIAGSTDNKVYIWDYEGNLLPGWPITLPAMVQAKVAVGDIDNNGDMEIVIAARDGYVYIYNHDGTPYPNWPQNANGILGLISPTLFDLDRDGDLEIIMVQMQSGQPGHVYVWHHTGQIYPGWPQNMDYLGVATAAVGDIDNDNIFEIVALSYYSVYVWDQNGNIKPGWPKLNVAGGMSYAQPVIADLDDDDDFEILHAYYTSSQNYVGIYHHDGTNFTNWPQPYPGPQTYTTPVVGDIDGDGDLEIFGGGHVWGAPDLLARHHTGNEVSGWPVICDVLECSPVICDIDNDGQREVLIGDNLNPGNFYAYEGNGTLVPGWPISITSAVMVNSPAVGDVDLDGDIEIALVVRDGTVNLWTIEGIPYRGYYTEWGTFFHDNWNTGWFHPKPPKNLFATGYSSFIKLTWNKNKEPDIAGYNVYRSTVSGGPYTKINTSLITDTTYLDYDVVPGITYYYCVTAQIKAFAESRLSNEAFASVNILEEKSKNKEELIVAPNPFKKSIYFYHLDKKPIYVKIYDIKGNKIDELKGYNLVWEPKNLFSQKIYILEIQTERGKFRKKIIQIK